MLICRFRTWCALIVLGAMMAPAVRAQPAEERSPHRFEITPFMGYRAGGYFDVEGTNDNADVEDHVSFALALDLRVDASEQYGLFWSRQNTRIDAPAPQGADLRVDYLQIGGTLVIEEDPEYVLPYIVGTAGIAHFSADAPGAHDDTRFALTFAIGVRVPMRPQFDLRFEARGYVTFMDPDKSVFCGADASETVCRFRGSGSLFTQYEVLAGVAYRF